MFRKGVNDKFFIRQYIILSFGFIDIYRRPNL